MFRGLSRIARPQVVRTVAPQCGRSLPLAVNQFSSSAVALKKGGRKNNNTNAKDSKEEVEGPGIEEIKSLVKGVEAKFKDTVEQFLIKTTEVRQGRASSAKIGQIRVPLSSDEGTQELRSLANIQMKNNNRTIVLTVFDPRHVKYVTASVLAEIGVTPQVDSRNEQVVTITIPTRTADANKELIKQMRHEYEHFRNSPSKHSLTYIREDLIKHLKKYGKSGALTTDETQAFVQEVEKQFKKYSTTLSDQLKNIEKGISSGK
uniref:Ribosome-recycling factor, mitochondrial n=1 Tax=Blastobotrys adeninivorans TaxID=409370 RepID=A0A060TCR8_BLAAD